MNTAKTALAASMILATLGLAGCQTTEERVYYPAAAPVHTTTVIVDDGPRWRAPPPPPIWVQPRPVVVVQPPPYYRPGPVIRPYPGRSHLDRPMPSPRVHAVPPHPGRGGYPRHPVLRPE